MGSVERKRAAPIREKQNARYRTVQQVLRKFSFMSTGAICTVNIVLSTSSRPVTFALACAFGAAHALPCNAIHAKQMMQSMYSVTASRLLAIGGHAREEALKEAHAFLGHFTHDFLTQDRSDPGFAAAWQLC